MDCSHLSMSQVAVYGTDWCPNTRRTLEHLRNLGVPFDYINIEHDANARRWVQDQNEGKERKPTLDISGRILSEPSDSEVDRALASAGIRHAGTGE